ncbi:YceI family protein [Aureisphaera galaxeae]|uniref:YceI family protein n=1 Tax=Aureisphaera galaxeae TaxID=1538023 RepID=UPI002350A14E|nr:YceI family protein [Aureisphaera galaxeae]MDC8005873.1 YceI family protein [Aureisphaera galaxeae]
MKTTKSLFTILLIVAGFTSKSALSQKYIDTQGAIVFEASEELFEPVKATNKTVSMVADMSKNEIAALALMKGFRFKNSLMEEHFNENYVESETYPKAIFKGKLKDFNFSQWQESSAMVLVEGTLKLHGEEKAIETPVTLTRDGDTIRLQGSFSVTPADFAIEIPKIVRNKIAKEIKVLLDFNLTKK